MVRDDEKVRRALLRWFNQQGRSFPWRNTKDPYQIWVSEVMLQQTQTARVIEYYPLFLRRFPTLRSLARARWSEVLPRWRGLGYYQRAQRMLECARILVNEQGGVWPRTIPELRSLPGIGDYTAAAILSFSFGKPIPALDTNIFRVISRLWGCKEKRTVIEKSKELFSKAGRQAPLLNHALMDLGALHCRSRIVQCDVCPLAQCCHFFLEGSAKRLRKQIPKKKLIEKSKQWIDVGAACIHRNGKYLIGKRSKARGGLWEFVGGKREKGESLRQALKREIFEEIGVEVSVRPAFLVVPWQENGRNLRLHFCRVQILRGRPRKTEHQELRWVPQVELVNYKFPEANLEAVRRLMEFRGPGKK